MWIGGTSAPVLVSRVSSPCARIVRCVRGDRVLSSIESLYERYVAVRAPCVCCIICSAAIHRNSNCLVGGEWRAAPGVGRGTIKIVAREIQGCHLAGENRDCLKRNSNDFPAPVGRCPAQPGTIGHNEQYLAVCRACDLADIAIGRISFVQYWQADQESYLYGLGVAALHALFGSER